MHQVPSPKYRAILFDIVNVVTVRVRNRSPRARVRVVGEFFRCPLHLCYLCVALPPQRVARVRPQHQPRALQSLTPIANHAPRSTDRRLRRCHRIGAAWLSYLHFTLWRGRIGASVVRCVSALYLPISCIVARFEPVPSRVFFFTSISLLRTRGRPRSVTPTSSSIRRVRFLLDEIII